MCNRLVAIILIFCSASASLSSVFEKIGFEMNKNYIAKELCINRDKPQLHCNGKCYLMKKLKQAEEKEQKQEKQSLKLQVQVTMALLPFVFKQYSFAAINFYVPMRTGIPQSALTAIFHPPQVAC